MKKYKERYISFQHKMTGTVILFLVFTFILITALFYSAGMNIKEETLKNVSYSAGRNQQQAGRHGIKYLQCIGRLRH